MKTQLLLRDRLTKLFIAFLAIAITTTPSAALTNASGPATGGTSVTIDGIHFTQVSVGETFAIGLSNIGTVYTWGENSFGELGNGTLVNSLTPVSVLTSASTPLDHISQVAAGANFGLALTDTGNVYSWGLNDVGQLGINDVTDSLFAVQVLGLAGAGYLSDIVAIEANGSSAYALTRTNGEVFAWGNNAYGQLGLGTSISSLVPELVRNADNSSSLNSISKISAGTNTMYAIGAGGQLWSWGRNNKKQLGDTLITQRLLPVKAQFSGMDFGNVAFVSGGDLHAIAITVSGDVYSWGNNTDGATGRGTLSGTSNIGLVSGLTNVSKIYTAANVSFALRSDGKFYSWGAGTNKTLGDGGVTRNTPALVTPGVPLASLTDGTTSMLGLDANGNVYGWGSNTTGIVGDGTTTVRPAPVLGVNFLASNVTFAGIAGTDLAANGTQWTVTSPAGTGGTTAIIVGEAALRTGTTSVATTTFSAGSFQYEAVVVPTPDPTPTVTPTPDPTPTVTPTPTVEPSPSVTPEPSVEPTPTPTVEPDPEPTVIAIPSQPATPSAPVATTSPLVVMVAPEHAIHPAVSGSPHINHAVVTSAGTWTGYPKPVTTIQWYRCSASVSDGLTSLPKKAKCKAIAGATHAKYKLTQKDEAKYVVALISAKNSVGTQSVTSHSTKKVHTSN